MKNNKGNAVVVAVVAVAVLLVGGLLFTQKEPLGAWVGNSVTFPAVFEDTVEINGALTQEGTVTLDGEVTLSGEICSEVTWNPGAVTTSSPELVEVALDSTYALGDLLLVGFNTSTLTLELGVHPSGTNAAVTLTQPDGDSSASVNIATGTLKVCYFD